MHEPEADKLEIQQPLEILRSSARRLMDRQMPASASKLEELYAHIKGAVADSVETVSGYVTRSLELARENFPDELDPEILKAAQAAVEDVQSELQAALSQVKETFFAAASFQECEALLPNLALFESRLEGSLQRLEQTVAMVDDPEHFGPPRFIPVPTISDALEALGDSLEQIHQHMRDGSKEPLRLALEQVRRAQIGLSAALAE
ncbi:MAG: hypothetical protein KF760_02425 [Candidatus Eremiobacteraeota bacterium]|nr:hypothetical protein [Candidatus Eremiobacteraeota bacterium]MCW5871432.1 hypothetical protein [Candidatus Eremiobacteraeota bacterium]